MPRSLKYSTKFSVKTHVANDLEHRFLEFLASLPDAECLDSPGFTFPHLTRKADFLLDHRKIVAEVKTVKNDPQFKLDRHIDNYLDRTGIIVYGTVSTHQLFRSAEESEKFHNKIIRDITRNTEEMCRSADDQIFQANRQLSISATGLLIILNESVIVLDPHVVARRACEYLFKNPRSVHYCLLVFESHEVLSSGDRQHQMLAISADHRGPNPGVENYLSGLMRRWAEHNGTEYVEKVVSDPASISYLPKDKP